jgi:hypothetical protein
MRDLILAAQACDLRGSATGALHLYWKAILGYTFKWLDDRSIEYSSTETALLAFFRVNMNTEYPSLLMTLYHVAIILEFYPDGVPDEDVIKKYVAQARHVLKFFDPRAGDLSSDKDLMVKEIDSHTEDCKWSLTSHFYAAERFQFRQNWSIKYPLVVLSGVAAFLTLGSLHRVFSTFHFNEDFLEVFLEFLALLIVILSGLNAASNMEQRAEKHRTAANKYITIRREARQLRIEVETSGNDPSTMHVLLEKLANIKNMLNNIAQDAPQIPTWAFEHTNKELAGTDT